MTHHPSIPHVGAPDPELRNSPIAEEEDVVGEEIGVDDAARQGARPRGVEQAQLVVDELLEAGDNFVRPASELFE